MTMALRNIYIFLLACFLTPSTLLANSENVFQDLSSGEFEKVKAAVETMVASGDEQYYPVLNSISESSLYIYKEKKENSGLVIAIPVKDNSQELQLYTLWDIFPAFIQLKDNSGFPVEVPASILKEVKITRAIRNLLQPVTSEIQLHHWDIEKKKLAVKSLAYSGDFSNIGKLEKVLESATDPIAQRVTREGIYQLKLKSPDKKERLEAIQGLVENNGADAQNILQEHLKGKEQDAEVIEACNAAISRIESRNNNIEIAQNLFTGLSLGSILILMALGLAIIYGLMGIINMAHGEFMMIGAYTTFVVQSIFIQYLPSSLFSYYFWIALPFSFLIAGLFGIIIEYLVIRHLYNKPLESLLATWGVSLVLVQLARTLFGDLTSVKAPTFATGGFEIVAQLVLPFNRLFIIALTALVVSVVMYILFKTSFGLKIRAVTQNRNMSACLGIPTKKVNRYAFFLGTGIAGVGGWALTLIGNVVPNMGQTYIVDSFLVVVTGGVGKLIGTIVSGLGIGFTSKLLEPVFQAVYGKVIILILVILFLQIKPTGLFPAKGRSED